MKLLQGLIGPYTTAFSRGMLRKLSAASWRSGARSLGQDQGEIFGTTVNGGSVNQQTLALSPALAAYAAGQRLHAKIGAALTTTTTTPTMNVDGLGALNLKQFDGSALTFGGELLAGAVQSLMPDGAGAARVMDLPWKSGLFTPTMVWSAGSTTAYGAQAGYFFRLGPLVLFHCQVVSTTVAGTGTASASIGGLPYLAAVTAHGIHVIGTGFNFAAYPSAAVGFASQVSAATSSLVVQAVQGDGTVSVLGVGFGNGDGLEAQGVYFTKDPL